ncbi:MAG: type II/IV secretion system ATPase subunit [Nanoarchaeota archaeon]
MLFKKETQQYGYEIIRESGQDIMYINFLKVPFVPSIAEQGQIMARIIDYLIENPNTSRIVLVQQRNYSHSFSQVSLLTEIASLYNTLIQQVGLLRVDPRTQNICRECTERRNKNMTYFLSILKQDPIAAYYEIKRFRNEEEGKINVSEQKCRTIINDNIRVIERTTMLLESTSIYKKLESSLPYYKFGEREIYNNVLQPDVVPNFTFTRLLASLPTDAEIVKQYQIAEGSDESTVTIMKKKDDLKYFYHLMPPEYSLSEDHYYLLNLARNVLVEHAPKNEEFTDPERTRHVFINVSKDLLRELAANKGVAISYQDLEKLANILVRHTIGFGILEVLLQDENIQDMMLNAPASINQIFIKHGEFDECVTNIIPSQEDVQSWAAKFRILSGRPLDEANPVLDTNLELGRMSARVAIIQQPLSPNGLAYAFRRHRDNPWTLPLFIKNKMLSPLAAGLLSFLIDGARTFLVAGTRSSGKTSLLGALMLEIMPKYRVIVLEDTLELPVEALREIGYDILRMKVRSALLEKTSEVAADEGIRTSLRLGDSSLIVGEVRSIEARALYEAMRVGALANVVAGTIHGASPYGVFDRVVNDLEVPATSFKATDLIIIANPVRSADGQKSYRRMIQLTEVRKGWSKDPEEEHGFVDLLRYNVEKDMLEPTDELINGDSEVIKAIAANVKGWAGNWDAVWDNIQLRAKIKEEIVKQAEKNKTPELLEAKFNSLSNSAFYKISEKVTKQEGLPKSEIVFPQWEEWLKQKIKEIKSGKNKED